MSAAVNYTDSYDSSISNHLKRSGSTRQYASSLQRTSDVHTKATISSIPTTYNRLTNNPSAMANEVQDTLKSSGRIFSSTSLSSTGYDSNSSPSTKSKPNSITTTNSNDLIIHSTCSSSSSSSFSSNDEQQHQQLKSWVN